MFEMDKIHQDEQAHLVFLQQILYVLFCLVVTIILIRILCYLSIGWNRSNVCLVGKTALITGGNSGLGYQTALMLASRGARVILADKNDLTESKRKIIEETKNPNIITKFLDLADFETIRNFAKEINKEEQRLDILINNAGIAGTFPGFTKDGLQIQMQVNHFGPFLLTHLLVDLLKKSAPSRIIFISSWMCFINQLSIDNLNKDPEPGIGYLYRYLQYSKSKLCNAIASIGFAEKLKGTGVTSNALHPGLVKTPIITSATTIHGINIFKQIFDVLMFLFGKTAYQGAQTHAYLAMAEEVKDITGRFFSDCRLSYNPWITRDKAFCEKIWKASEEFVKLSPEEKLQ